GLSFFGEGRQGVTGWAAVGGVDYIQPDTSNDGLAQHRYIFGGAHWRQIGSGRLGIVVTMEQVFQASNSLLMSRRLLGQTHVEFLSGPLCPHAFCAKVGADETRLLCLQLWPGPRRCVRLENRTSAAGCRASCLPRGRSRRDGPQPQARRQLLRLCQRNLARTDGDSRG